MSDGGSHQPAPAPGVDMSDLAPRGPGQHRRSTDTLKQPLGANGPRGSWFQRSMYVWIGGARSVSDPAGSLARSVFYHNLHVMGLALLLAVAMVPVVYLHQAAQVGYLDAWQRAGGHTGTVSATLGHAGMFDDQAADPAFSWWFAAFYALSALTSVIAGIYLWVGVITRFRNTTTMVVVLATWAILFPVYCIGCFVLAPQAGYQMSRSLFTAPSFLGVVVSNGVVGWASRKHLRFPRFGWFMAVQSLVNAVVFWLYLAQLPTWFLTAHSDWERLFIRLIIHPLMFEAVSATHRMAAMMYPKNLSEKRLSIAIVPTVIVANLLGRFLVSNMTTTWGTITMTVLLGLQELAMRLSTPLRDYCYCLIAHRCRSPMAASIAFSSGARHIKGDVLNLEVLAEFFGIFVSPVIILVYNMRIGGEKPALGDLAFSTAFQFITEWVVDVAPTVVVLLGHKRLLASLQRPDSLPLAPVIEVDSEDEGERAARTGARARAAAAGRVTPVTGVVADVPTAAWSSLQDIPDTPTASGATARGNAVDGGSGLEAPDADAGASGASVPLQYAVLEVGGGAGAAGGGSVELSTTLVAPSSAGAAATTGGVGGQVDALPPAPERPPQAVGASRASVDTCGPPDEPVRPFVSHQDMFEPDLSGEGGTGSASYNLPRRRSSVHPADLGPPASLRSVQMLRSLKASLITSLNCWDVRFKHFEAVMLVMALGWTSYFLRSFFYPGSAMCGVLDDDGAWAFTVCSAD